MYRDPFEQKFIIDDLESMNNFIKVMESEVTPKTVSECTEAQRKLERGELLLRQCRLR